MLEIIIVLVSILISIGLICPIIIVAYLLLHWYYRLEQEEKSYNHLEEEYYERIKETKEK